MKCWLFVASLPQAASLVSCASRSNAPIAKAPTGGPSLEQPPFHITPEGSSKEATRASVAISDEIARACGLTQTEAYFAFDSARVDTRAAKVLRKLADCFAKGPLAGRGMRLVGHADPRGDEEYNLVLGGQRADSVARTLRQLGLPDNRMSTSSRDEMDDSGTDEASWGRDRRVDVLLGS
jgi:peptidoglycan-associated lipoprotein